MGIVLQNIGGGNEQPPIDAYSELNWRALKSAIANAPTRWLYLDSETLARLAERGLDKEDLREAINVGVNRGELERKVIDGERALRLARKEASSHERES